MVAVTNIIDKIIFPTIITTATSVYPNVGYQSDIPIPEKNYEVRSIHNNFKLLYENEYYNSLSLSPDDSSDKLATIYNFAKNLLAESIDLQPDIVNMVDEEFWDLI